MFEHDAMAAMRAKHPGWIWNRSDNHVLVGVPGSLEGLKTVVEPGNCFSPGPGSYGVSTWVFDRAAGTLFAPEAMDLASLSWRFLDGRVPVLVSTWRAGALEVVSRLFTRRAGHAGDVKDYLTVACRNAGPARSRATLYLVIRSFGPAGGPVTSLALGPDGLEVSVNGAPALRAESAPDGFGATSYADSGRDVGEFLREGTLPGARAVDDPSSWASGALAWEVDLAAGEERSWGVVAGVRGSNRFLEGVTPLARAPRAADAEAELVASWRERIGVEFDLPDPRYAEAFYAQLVHLAMFTVADAPRISPISYPIFWLRDGSYAVTALDRGGFHEFAAAACRGVMRRDAFGGFGSEGDGPGELAWMITEHWLLTRDRAFLEEAWPHLARLAALVERMRTTTEPIRAFTEFVMPQQTLAVETDVLCLAAQGGLVRGRMDHGIQRYWCSGWCYLALDRVARCARELGRLDEAARLERGRDELRAALAGNAPASFGRDPRDVNSALWPTGWATGDEPGVRAAYQAFWDRTRYAGGIHRPEKLWTYFEAGTAHNYLVLGEREKAWVSIEHLLSRHVAPGLYTYHEGDGDENSFMLWPRLRGWDRIKYVTPHGWTGAELFHLLRDGLVREEGEGLAIGMGVPRSWVDAGRAFGVRGLPTHAGRVSWRYDPSTRRLDFESERPVAGRVRLAIPGAD